MFPVMKLRALPEPVKNYSSVETPAKGFTMSSIISCSQIDFLFIGFWGGGRQCLDFYQVCKLPRLTSPTLYLVSVRYARRL